MISATVLAVTTLALPTLAAGQPPGLSEAQSITLGKEIVTRNCAMCHAVGRDGASPNKDAPPFRDLHQRMDVEMLGEGLTQGILTGHPAMPAFRFAPHEVIAIVRYLRAVQARQSASL